MASPPEALRLFDDPVTELGAGSKARAGIASDRTRRQDALDVRLAGIGTALRQARQERDPVARAALVAELARLADDCLPLAIAHARASGPSWRLLGARVGIPYQSLHRRFAAGSHVEGSEGVG